MHHKVTVFFRSPLTFSTGKYVKLADGAILVQVWIIMCVHVVAVALHFYSFSDNSCLLIFRVERQVSW